jgi:hypothetical protein
MLLIRLYPKYRIVLISVKVSVLKRSLRLPYATKTTEDTASRLLAMFARSHITIIGTISLV